MLHSYKEIVLRRPCEKCLRFFHIRRPAHLETLLDALVHGTVVLVMGQSAVGFGAFAFRDFQFVAQVHGRDAEEFVIGFDAAFDVGFEVIGCGDSTRFQRAGKCAGQSTGERGNDVINRRRQRFRVLYAVILRVAPVRAELQRLREALDMRLPKRPFLLNQPDFRRVNDFTHRPPPGF